MNEEEKIKLSPEDGKTESWGGASDKSQNVRSETSDVKKETTNQTSDIQKSEIIDMEVHRHPNMEKKEFKQYNQTKK
jgi:hypothetical protein